MKMIANWDYQHDGWRPSATQSAWWAESKLHNYEYVYRAEFWQTALGKFAVLFSYKKHPLTGKRYIERRNADGGWAAVNEPIVVALEEFPPVD